MEFLTAHVPQEVAAASAEGWKRERTEAALAAARCVGSEGGKVLASTSNGSQPHIARDDVVVGSVAVWRL